MQKFSIDLDLIRSTCKPREVFSLDEITADFHNPFVLAEFKENNWIFDYFGHLQGRKNLVVIFTCAQADLSHILCPFFMRWSWVDNFPFPNSDVLCIADPTMRLHPTLLGGWFQGVKQDWVLSKILYHLTYIQHKYNYQKIIFSSGSLGGFASLQAATLLPFFSK